MTKIMSLEDLSRLRDELTAKRAEDAGRGLRRVAVGMGSCGIAAGAADVFRALEAEIEASKAEGVVLTQIGCQGLCANEPIVEVVVGTSTKVTYGRVNADMVKRIVGDHILGGQPVQAYVVDSTPFPTI
jgi:(2Fe-2S) ferredoxin